MENPTQIPPVSKAAWWTGVILSVLPSLALLSGLVMLFVSPEKIRQGMVDHGYPESVIVPLIVVEFVCAVLYLIPQTAVLGAILLTGYLGGAVATHVRAAEWSQFPFAVLFGIVLWLGLYLRDARIRALAPWRSL